MGNLVLAPNQPTSLSSSATYGTAYFSVGSSLSIDGAGTVITVQGATTAAQGTPSVRISNGAAFRALGPFSGAVQIGGAGSTIEVGAGTTSINLTGGASSVGSAVVLDDPAAQISAIGFIDGDTFRFGSPAVSFSCVPYTGADPLGSVTLRVTEASGATVGITLEEHDQVYSIANVYIPYTTANFAIVNGAVTYNTIPPPAPPVLSGMQTAQRVAPGKTIMPFAAVTIADATAGATETLTVKLGTASGTLTDPQAASDGGVYNPATTTYTVTGSAAAVSQAIDGLVFTRPPTRWGPATASRPGSRSRSRAPRDRPRPITARR